MGKWTVESAFLELKQIEGSHSSANKKKQALKMKENAAAYVAFWKKNNPAANSNQQGNVAPPRQGRQGNGPPHHSPLIPSPQTCNQFQNYPGWENPPTPLAKACFCCDATSHIVKGCNTNPVNQNAVGQQAKVNFNAFVQKINAWKMKMNKINILIYFCCISALVSSSQSSIQSAFVAKQSNGATALADSACSNTIVNDPNFTTKNTPPAMSISIKQANGDLIPVTMQGDLAIHPDLLPLQDVFVVPNCEMNLLSVAHMCETWDASAVLNFDQIRVMKKKINLSKSQTILSGPQNNGLYYLALPSRTNHQQSYAAEEVTHSKNEIPKDASSSQPLHKKRICRTLYPTHEKEWKYWHNRLCHFSGLKKTINACVVDSLPLQYHRLRMDQNVCTACELAKAKKKSHTPGTRTKQKLSEMLHIDNHEKNILSYRKNKYSLSVVENYFKMDLSEFLKKKSDAGKVLINLIAKLQRQLDVKIKIIQCDGAQEFVGSAMKIG